MPLSDSLSHTCQVTRVAESAAENVRSPSHVYFRSIFFLFFNTFSSVFRMQKTFKGLHGSEALAVLNVVLQEVDLRSALGSIPQQSACLTSLFQRIFG